MKICFLGWADHVHVERWVNYFAEAGHDVSVISVSGQGSYLPSVRQFRLHAVPVSDRLRRMYLRYLLRRLRPDVVHVHWAPFVELLDGLWNGALVVTAWGSDIYAQNGSSQAGWLRGLQRAHVLTCDSEDLADRTARLTEVPRERVAVVQWGVDTDSFSPTAEPSPLATALGIEGRPVVLSPRNFAPLYNLDTVVDAFGLVRRERADAVLLMKRYAGSDDYVERIRGKIEQAGLTESVKIVDRVPYDQMPDFYRSGQVLVSVPSSDATPVSLLEGMACGCSPVVSDLPSVREWVRDRWNGRIVPIADAAALGRAICDLLADGSTRRTFQARNRELVERAASQRASMTRMTGLYEAALAASPGS